MGQITRLFLYFYERNFPKQLETVGKFLNFIPKSSTYMRNLVFKNVKKKTDIGIVSSIISQK